MDVTKPQGNMGLTWPPPPEAASGPPSLVPRGVLWGHAVLQTCKRESLQNLMCIRLGGGEWGALHRGTPQSVGDWRTPPS